ncbi:hypothetical protein BDN72DRAFT_843257 [Pluteus cervinus]|uniref:Uncharacterized protein n=1 Tax=Pluteus cervinus TaxID=181527 RepID=A0ACD3AP56_9AGAR|nr:hypothetical protein BDN72DRAFT_843257 [Pluteus cervinus]
MPSNHHPHHHHAERLKTTPNVRYSHFEGKTDSSRLISVIWEVENGQNILINYIGPATYYIIEGEVTATENDQTKLLHAGDVMEVEQGSAVTWSSPSKGKSFGVVYTPSDSVLEDYFKEEFIEKK